MLSKCRSLITLIIGAHINEKLRMIKSHIVPPAEYSVTPTLTHYEKRSLYLICIFPTIIFRSEETEHIALAPPSVLPFSYKKYFVSYGDINYTESLNRIGREAESLGLFDEVRLYSDNSLPEPFKGYTQRYKRGGGYWMWKPWVIHDMLERKIGRASCRERV